MRVNDTWEHDEEVCVRSEGLVDGRVRVMEVIVQHEEREDTLYYNENRVVHVSQ